MADRSTNSSNDQAWKVGSSDDDEPSQGEDQQVANGGPGVPKIRSRAIDVNQPLVVMFPDDDSQFDGYFVHVEGFASMDRPKVIRGSVRLGEVKPENQVQTSFKPRICFFFPGLRLRNNWFLPKYF
jgi:hypothetical protein